MTGSAPIPRASSGCCVIGSIGPRSWGVPSPATLAFSGQLSYQNLDPSEQFYLGGPAGVRAYPVSSNGGSTGQLLTTELRWAALKSPALHLRAEAAL